VVKRCLRTRATMRRDTAIRSALMNNAGRILGGQQPENGNTGVRSGRSRKLREKLHQDCVARPGGDLKWPLPSLRKQPTDASRCGSVKGDTVQVIRLRQGQKPSTKFCAPFRPKTGCCARGQTCAHATSTRQKESGRISTEEASVHALQLMVFSTSSPCQPVGIEDQADGRKKTAGSRKNGELID